LDDSPKAVGLTVLPPWSQPGMRRRCALSGWRRYSLPAPPF